MRRFTPSNALPHILRPPCWSSVHRTRSDTVCFRRSSRPPGSRIDRFAPTYEHRRASESTRAPRKTDPPGPERFFSCSRSGCTRCGFRLRRSMVPTRTVSISGERAFSCTSVPSTCSSPIIANSTSRKASISPSIRRWISRSNRHQYSGVVPAIFRTDLTNHVLKPPAVLNPPIRRKLARRMRLRSYPSKETLRHPVQQNAEIDRVDHRRLVLLFAHAEQVLEKELEGTGAEAFQGRRADAKSALLVLQALPECPDQAPILKCLSAAVEALGRQRPDRRTFVAGFLDPLQREGGPVDPGSPFQLEGVERAPGCSSVRRRCRGPETPAAEDSTFGNPGGRS